MALLSLTVLFYAVPLYLAYRVISSDLTRRRLQNFARANGATFPKHVPSALPFGIAHVWRIVSAARRGDDILDDIIEGNYAANGCTTFSMAGLFGGPAEVHTIDPANIQAVLATRFADFVFGERRIEQFRPMLGRSIFTADGAFWEHSRALFRPQFSRDHINDLRETERAVQALLDALPLVASDVSGDGGVLTVDLMPPVFRFTLDTSTGFLFGESVESQTAAATGRSSTTSALTAMAVDQAGSDMSFASAFHEAQVWITTRVRLQGFYWLAPSAKGKKATEYLRKYVGHYVQLALLRSAKPDRSSKEEEEKVDEEEEGEKSRSLLDTMVEQVRDEGELRDQILGILLAGRDTTAALLSWVLLLLAQHPHEYDKLRASVIADFGPYAESPSSEQHAITFATLKASQYLQFVLREALRVANPVPINMRKAARDTVLPRGGGPDGTKPVVVAKGQTVNFVPYALHRRRDIWGEDAREFKPARWEGVKLDWNYIPFSGGPRICIGQQFALTEAAYLLVRLVQRFESMEWVGPQGKPRKDMHFTMAPRDGVHVRLKYAEA